MYSADWDYDRMQEARRSKRFSTPSSIPGVTEALEAYVTGAVDDLPRDIEDPWWVEDGEV